jgi:HSP20 family molecular chaperone IbpA
MFYNTSILIEEMSKEIFPRAYSAVITPTEFELKVPGYGKEHIKVSVEDKKLNITGKNGDKEFSKQYVYNQKIHPQLVEVKYEYAVLKVKVQLSLLDENKVDIDIM